ncbi:hypothetical protein [Aliikangiella coralliicola]|uniref:hypothetical protein n=1 Tax=Aliikangiella coralliicola TaxID=2592383 RepID=UPI00143DE791|nr:hypothetical protein [Aliikangiella coralliicola]
MGRLICNHHLAEDNQLLVEDSPTYPTFQDNLHLIRRLLANVEVPLVKVVLR